MVEGWLLGLLRCETNDAMNKSLLPRGCSCKRRWRGRKVIMVVSGLWLAKVGFYRKEYFMD